MYWVYFSSSWLFYLNQFGLLYKSIRNILWSHGKGNMKNRATRSSSHKERRLVSWNENFKKVQGITMEKKWIAKAS